MSGDDSRDREPRDTGGEDKDTLSPWQIVKSVLAAAVGVQSEEARERDFRRGKASHFIIAGVVFTVAFILVLVLIVRMVVQSATG
ncbi:MAG: DUF2970 domain-containing protein [Ectothiorhodospiraceae bacterium]|jgi:hypothetical protein